MMRIAILALLFSAGAARADMPALEPATAGDVSVSLPRGWKVTTDATKGLFLAQRDPSRKDSPVVLVLVQASGITATEDQLLDAIAAQVAKDLKTVDRQALPGGGHVLLGEGVAGDVKVRLGVLAYVANGGAIVSLLASRTDEFERLGGLSLVVGMLKSMSAKTAPPPAAPAATAPVSGLTVRDLAGEWSEESTTVANYANRSTGTYAGYSSFGHHNVYIIKADGTLTEKFNYVTSGLVGLKQVAGDRPGKVTLSAEGLLALTTRYEGKETTQYYGVRSFTDKPDETVMVVNGPWYPNADGKIDPDALAPGRAWNLNANWVRKKK